MFVWRRKYARHDNTFDNYIISLVLEEEEERESMSLFALLAGLLLVNVSQGEGERRGKLS